MLFGFYTKLYSRRLRNHDRDHHWFGDRQADVQVAGATLANEPIGNLYFETMVAIYTRNLLVALVRDVSSVRNMKLLFGFTACVYWHYALDLRAIVSISKLYFPPGEATRRPLKFVKRECAR